MRFNGVNLLSCVVELGSIGELVVSSGAGLLVLVWMMCAELLGVFLKEFKLFRRVTGSMKQECIFRTGWGITQMPCIFSIALSSTALIGVGWRGGYYYPFPPANTGMVNFLPLIILGRYYSFVY